MGGLGGEKQCIPIVSTETEKVIKKRMMNRCLQQLNFHKVYPVTQVPWEPVLCPPATKSPQEDDGRGGLKTPPLKNDLQSVPAAEEHRRVPRAGATEHCLY